MTSEKIVEMIQSLQEYASSDGMDFDVLRQKNKDLFFSLLQEDSFFFVAADPNCSDESLHEKSFLPYIAPTTQQSKLPYLRIFSDKQTAESFAKSVGCPEKDCIPLPAVESAQLAKYWLMRGVYGYMLNDGSTWATISFQDYLSMFFHEILGRPEMYNEEFASDVNLLVTLDCEEPVTMLLEEGKLKISSSTSSEASNIQMLLEECMKTDEVLVSLPLLSFQTSAATLLQTAKEYHPKIRKEPPTLDTGTQEPPEAFPFKDEKYVNLDFAPSDDLEFATEQPVAAEDKSTADDKSSVNPVASSNPKEKPARKPFFQAFIAQFKKEPSQETTAEEDPISPPEEKEHECSSSDENQSDSSSFTPPTNEPTQEIEGSHPCNLDKVQESENKLDHGKKFGFHKKFLLRAVGVVAIVIVFVMAGSFLFNLISPIREFSNNLDENQYSKANELYIENQDKSSFTDEADGILKDRIDEIVNQYAKNEIDATTAAAKLKEYQVFSSISSYYEKAMQQAAALEQSKNAAVFGSQAIESGNYLQGLESWTSVIPQDVVNYEAIQTSIQENEDMFISNGLLECSQYLNNNQQEYYQAGIELLHHWFPTNKSISKAYSSFSSEDITFGEGVPGETNSFPFGFGSDSDFSSQDTDTTDSQDSSSSTPIVISKCSVSMPQSNGAIRLYIDWTNTSDRVIKEISFLVRAKDEFGNEMFCYKGNYSMYQAIAKGPWAPGEGMNSKQTYWDNAWYNSRISQVDLLQIDITYSDGKTEQISKTSDIQKLFS